MALTETTVIDKIEIVSQYKVVQVRKANIIKKDGVEITRAYERYVLDPGTLDESNNLVENQLTNIPNDVKDICNLIWTDSIKNAWKDKLINEKLDLSLIHI